MNPTTERPWSDLPEELLSTIANFLTSNPNLLNTLTFRSVCNSWRNSCPPFSQPSILSPLLPLSIERFRPPFYLPYSSLDSKLTVTVIYTLHRPHVSSSIPYTWVLFADEFEPGKVKIRLPFSKGSYNMNKFFPDFVNLFDFDVHEIGRFYNLSYGCYYDDSLCVKLEKPRFCSEDVIKVVLFGDGSAAVALFQGGKLGVCRLGVGVYKEGEWEVIHCGKGFRFDDIVEYKGGVLGVDRRGRVYEVGYSSSEIIPVVRSIASGDGRRNRLVESLGRLYLVVRCDVGSETNGVALKVYELNERRKWVEVNGIGDRVFFFGIEFSFSVSAQELSFRKNCILFKRHSFQSYKGEVDDDAMFSKSGKNDLDIVVCHLDDASHAGAIEFACGYSATLWPPPAWIWPITRLERLRIIDVATDDLIMRIPENMETKFQDLIITTKASGGSCDDCKPLCSNIRRFAHYFKESVNRGMVNEQTLMNCEKKLQVFLYNFDHTQSSLVQAQTEGLRTEERQDCDPELHGSIHELTHFQGVHLSWDIWYMWGRMNASTFEYEDCFTDFSELVSRFYSLLNC